jgi:hypothetical protein
MSQLSRTALLLLKLELLRRARNGILARVLGRKLFSLKTAIIFKITMALLFVGVTCLVPLLTLSDFGAVSDFGQSLVKFHHLIINGIIMLLFYSGLFVGASMIYELDICENEQLLAYPMVIADLVQYRVMGALLVALNSCLYFFIPIIVLVFLALGWSAIWIAAMAVLTTMLLIAVFLLGVNALLSIARLMPRRGTHNIFVGIFLISGWLFLIAAQLFKLEYYGPGNMPLSVWLEEQLSQYSYSSIMDDTVSRTWGIGQYILSLAAGSMFLFSLVKMCGRSFERAYRRIILQANDMTAKPKQETMGLSFERLNRFLGILPLDLRALLTKDILALVRGPNLLLKALGSIVALVLVVAWKHSALAEPALFAIYFASTFVISRLFIENVGQERNNILVIKQLYPSVSRYLSVRTRITLGISLLVLLPICGLLVGVTTDTTWWESVLRIPLIIMTIVLTSILVTWYSAAFAEFSKDHIDKYKFCIHPAAMLFFWGFSSLVALFFYKLDLAILAHKSDTLTIILIVASGLTLAISMTVFRVLGIRRIRHYG